MYFRKATKEDHLILSEIAVTILESVYGNQDKAINEWITGDGYKNAQLLIINETIAGLLVLKMNPSKSYAKISTLIVVEEYRGNGVADLLLDKAFTLIAKNGFSEVVATVSETKESVLGFFMCAGFHLIKKCPDKYVKGITEFILRRVI